MASSSTTFPAEEFVKKTIADHQVVIFSKTWCSYCKSVKTLFRENFKSVYPEIVELNEHEHGTAIQDYLAKETGQTTVPSVFVNQKHVGGADKTHAAFNDGTLAQELRTSESTRQA